MPSVKRILSSTRWRIVIALLILFFIVRAMLPTIVLHVVNDRLKSLPGYYGKVRDIDIHLIRGAYTIRDIRIDQTSVKTKYPFFTADIIDLSIYWRQIFHRALVGRIRMEKPVINFVDTGVKGKKQTGAGVPWTKEVQRLFPFRIDRLEVTGGQVHFRNYNTDSPVNIYLNRIEGTAWNLTNSERLSGSMVAKVRATARAMGTARSDLDLSIDPYSKHPTFHVKTRIIDLDATLLNNLMRTYAGFDVKKGTFDLVIDVAANDGKLNGYVKPLFRHLQIFSWSQDVKKENKDVLHLFWEALIAGLAEVFENQPKDQLATTIPISGTVENPETGILSTIGGVLYNAFIRAVLPTFGKPVKPPK